MIPAKSSLASARHMVGPIPAGVSFFHRTERIKAGGVLPTDHIALCVWLGQEVSVWRTLLRLDARGGVLPGVIRVLSDGTKAGGLWRVGTKRDKRPRPGICNKNGDCRAHQGIQQSPLL
jgi:hypothetical protein